jgi:DNA-binding CsgD family transcriptional regulator
LKRRERELESKSRNLEELNTALQVLLKQREIDKDDFEGRALANIRELIIPHIEQLKKSNLKANDMVYVSLIESNLKDIISPLSYRLSSKYMTFTPKEIQVIKLIKEGKATIEISKLLNTSPGTIEFHRNNIRTKLKLKNKRANLRSYLMTLT